MNKKLWPVVEVMIMKCDVNGLAKSLKSRHPSKGHVQTTLSQILRRISRPAKGLLRFEIVPPGSQVGQFHKINCDLATTRDLYIKLLAFTGDPRHTQL